MSNKFHVSRYATLFGKDMPEELPIDVCSRAHGLTRTTWMGAKRNGITNCYTVDFRSLNRARKLLCGPDVCYCDKEFTTEGYNIELLGVEKGIGAVFLVTPCTNA